MPIKSGFTGISLDFDSGTNTFFGVAVKEALSLIKSKPVGKRLIRKLGAKKAPNNPDYNVLIVPMVNLSQNAMFFDKRFNSRGQLAQASTEALAKEWEGLKLGGGMGSGAQPDDWKGAESGTGSSSKLIFNNAQYVIEKGKHVPNFILLAHELVHCLHNLNGDNKGGKKITVGDEQIKHEEVYCVGLGDYSKEAICENAIRAEWKVPARVTYG